MAQVRSAKGVMVNFDLLKIKEEIAAGPKPVNVQKREDFIDRKTRRRVKKAPVPKVEVEVESPMTTEQEEQAEIKEVDTVTEQADEKQEDTAEEETATVKPIKK
jgi:hypothetical protein